MANIQQMRDEGLTEQEINDIVEGERYINNVIVPAYLSLPDVKTVYGDEVENEFRHGYPVEGIHKISYHEWYMHRDLCADLRPARYGFADAYSGQPARFVAISTTPEQWLAMWRKKTYGK